MEQARTNICNFMSTPPASPSPESAAVQATFEDAKAKYKASLTPEQVARLEAIEVAGAILAESEVPFALLASVESNSATMRFLYTSCLTYSKDIPARGTESGRAKQSLLPVALRHLSIGLRGGIAVYDKAGVPSLMFQDGVPIDPLAKPKITPS